MLRIAAGIRAPLRPAQVRCYSEGGFEISDYLSRIEAITKSRKPQNRGAAARGKRPAGQVQNRPQKQYQNPRGQRPPVKDANGREMSGAASKSGPRSVGSPRTEGKSNAQFNRRPRAQGPNTRETPRDSSQKTAASKPAAEQNTEKSEAMNVTGFTSLSSMPQDPLPKGSRRAVGASRAHRTRAKGARKPRAAPRTNDAALMARRALQASEQDSSFLHPKDALEIIMKNQNTTVNGFINVDDISLQALQPNMVSSAVSYNSRVRSLLRDLPEDVLADREQLNRLVRKHVRGSYDEGIVLEATGGNISTESLFKVLNANASFSGETKQLLANIGSGKVPIKQIARNA